MTKLSYTDEFRKFSTLCLPDLGDDIVLYVSDFCDCFTILLYVKNWDCVNVSVLILDSALDNSQSKLWINDFCKWGC